MRIDHGLQLCNFSKQLVVTFLRQDWALIKSWTLSRRVFWWTLSRRIPFRGGGKRRRKRRTSSIPRVWRRRRSRAFTTGTRGAGCHGGRASMQEVAKVANLRVLDRSFDWANGTKLRLEGTNKTVFRNLQQTRRTLARRGHARNFRNRRGRTLARLDLHECLSFLANHAHRCWRNHIKLFPLFRT